LALKKPIRNFDLQLMLINSGKGSF